MLSKKIFISIKKNKKVLETKKDKAYISISPAKVKKEKIKKVKYIINKG